MVSNKDIDRFDQMPAKDIRQWAKDYEKGKANIHPNMMAQYIIKKKLKLSEAQLKKQMNKREWKQWQQLKQSDPEDQPTRVWLWRFAMKRKETKEKIFGYQREVKMYTSTKKKTYSLKEEYKGSKYQDRLADRKLMKELANNKDRRAIIREVMPDVKEASIAGQLSKFGEGQQLGKSGMIPRFIAKFKAWRMKK